LVLCISEEVEDPVDFEVKKLLVRLDLGTKENGTGMHPKKLLISINF
jgi:hypothetical protein